MDNARRHPRFIRHVQVRFRLKGVAQTRAGYTTNISRGGMFIRTGFPCELGSRLEVEVDDSRGGLRLEAAVVHAAKVSPLLEKIRPSGMGIRFLPVEELVTALLPVRPGVARPALGESGPFTVTFEDFDHFVEVLRRDIAEGGVFVPTSLPPPIDSRVDVELLLPPPLSRSVTLPARVVLHFVGGESGAVPGMGLAFLEPREVLNLLRPLVETVGT